MRNHCLDCGKEILPASKRCSGCYQISQKGRIPWNKGLTDIYSEETRQSMGADKVGKTPWNKDKPGSQKGWMKGKHHTKESCDKMSKALKGRTAWNKGLKNCYSEETLHKMSESSKGGVAWNRGAKDLDAHIHKAAAYKQAILKRENHICQKCNEPGGVSHHGNCRRAFPEDQYSVEKGYCLCQECHTSFHKTIYHQGLFSTVELTENWLQGGV